MGNLVTNDGLGRIAEKVADGADLIIIPLSAMEADATVKDGYGASPTKLDQFLAAAGNTEQTTSWTRKVVLNASLTLTVDDSGDKVLVLIPDQTWTGPTAGNDTVDIVICEDGASDPARNVLTTHDFAVTADGNDVTADFDGTNGFWQSS